MERSRDILKMMVCVNCFILIASVNISIAVGIGYLVSELSAVVYFDGNKDFNDRSISGVSSLILKVFIISMMISGGFQLIAMSYLTIQKKCRTRTLERQQEGIEIPIISLMNGRRVVDLERPYGRDSDAYTVTLV